MKVKLLLVCMIIVTMSSLCALEQTADINDSITPTLNQMKTAPNLVTWKYSSEQMAEIQNGLKAAHNNLRVISFNILYDGDDSQHPAEYQTELRLPRLVSAILEMDGDVIAVQECFRKHLDYLLEHLGEMYGFCGYNEASNEEMNGILYKKSRLQLVESVTYSILRPEEIFYPETIMSHTVCKAVFKDMKTDQIFALFNTHLEFGSADIRARQVKEICEWVTKTSEEMGVILCGDLNTFPNLFDLSVPGHDGGRLISMLKRDGILQDTWEQSLMGHVGPIGSFTNDPNEAKAIPFKGKGTPGVVLDHIFATKDFIVLTHGINPIRVNGCFPSDHMPVMTDIVLRSEVTE